MRRLAILGFMLAGAVAAPLFADALRPERLPQLMQRVERSQREVASKQDMLLSYQRTTGGSERTRLFIEERLRDLVSSEHENARLYSELRRTVSAAAGAASAAQIAAIETAQRALEHKHGELSLAFGAFYQRLAPPAGAPVAPAGTSPGSPDLGFALGATPPAGALPPPMPGMMPPSPPAGDTGPASAAGPAAAPQITPDNQMQAMPMAPDDGEAAYRRTVSEIQAVLTSETATPREKAAAYQRFIQLSAQRRERKQ